MSGRSIRHRVYRQTFANVKHPRCKALHPVHRQLTRRPIRWSGDAMNRTERTQALASLPAQQAVQLANRLADHALSDVEVISPPTVGMVMARAVDGARGQTFNLGEILVTEARVSVGGVEGWGMVMGNAREHALAMAVVDASLEAHHP